MNKTIELYLGGKKVEWSSVPDILLTYQRTDYQNPTVTKNMFSKTLTIDGTQNNNNIFNHIWKLDRIMDDSYTLFNPSQRVSFELYDNGEIVEKGYAKLDSISKEGYKIAYNITLYGGLGSFFYSLAYDIDTDKEKALSDLNFTNTNNPDDEFTFEISKNNIWDAWSRIGKPNNTGGFQKWDYINFIPCYNGIPDDFDSDKVLINTHSATGLSVRYTTNDGVHYGTFPTSISDGESSYTPHNGYVYGEMRRECNEWEMRDLRSYLQRPALSVKGLFNAICNPINNGGFTVELDPQFFSTDNPYYDKAWITLPMIDASSLAEDTTDDWDWYCGTPLVEPSPRTMYLKIKNYTPFGDTPDKLKIRCEIHAKFTGATANTLYTTCICNGAGISVDGLPLGENEIVNSTAVQFYINKTDELGRQYTDDIASSNRIILSSKLPSGQFWDGGASWNDMPLTNHTKQVSLGVWKKVSGNDYVWTTYNNETEFSVDLETNSINTIPMVGFITKSVCRHDNNYCGYAYDAQYYGSRAEMNAHSFSHLYGEEPQNINSEVVFKGGYTVRSYQTITKKNILGGLDGTPCDWLLSYCKLFGLFIEKDKVEDKVYIKLRNNWYMNETVDLESLIDRSKEINVTPLTFESKWYNFKYTEAEGKLLDSYKEVYSQDFGKQLIDTKYNFDAEEIDLLEDNSFSNGITCLEKSNYFNVKYDQKNFNVFPCLYDWCTVSYFNDENNYDIYMALPAGTTTTYMNSNMAKEFYDFLPKLQFHDADNGGTDGVGVLVFFNGIKDTGEIDYWISDDVEEMFDQSDNPCWLQTHCEWNTSWTERVAIETHTLPEFNRYVVHSKIITAAWDFGYTRELYVPYYRYEVNRTPTLYENFWKSYISDLYSVNTRNVECNIALDTNSVNDFMKRFYWWDNCLWVCTKVSDFDIAIDKSTKCSFTKVNNMANYFAVPTFDDYFFNFYRTDGGGNIPAQGTDAERTVWFNLDSSSPWMVFEVVGYVNINGIYQGDYVIGQEINATFAPNYDPNPRICGFVANNGEGQIITVGVWQDGYVKEDYLTVTPSSITFPKIVSGGTSVVVSSSSDWYLTAPVWVVIPSHSTSSGETTLTISATTNDTGERRTGVITFRNEDGLRATVNVSQNENVNVTLEQKELFPVYDVPSSGGNVFYRIVNEVEATVVPEGHTANYAVASGKVSYNTTIQPQNGMNFWIHFEPNTGTVTRNAVFHAEYGTNVSRGGEYTDYMKRTSTVYEYDGVNKISGQTSDLLTSPVWYTISNDDLSKYNYLRFYLTPSQHTVGLSRDNISSAFILDVSLDDNQKTSYLQYYSGSLVGGEVNNDNRTFGVEIIVNQTQNNEWQVALRTVTLYGTSSTDVTDCYIYKIEGCDEKPENVRSVTNYVYPTIVKLPLIQKASGNTVVELSDSSTAVTTSLGASGMSWTATTQNNWITLTTTSGSTSDTSVQYTVAQNNGRYRTGYIYVTYTDEMGYYCNETIEIHQTGIEQPWIVTPTAVTVSDRGGDFSINVDSPYRYEVSMPDNWVSTAISRDNGFMMHIDPNTSYARTSNITVTSNGETKTVVVNQLSKYPSEYTLDYAPQDIVFDASGGTMTVTIRSDSDWTITEGNNIE